MPFAPYLTLLLAYRARWREQWYTPDALRRVRLARLQKLAEFAWTTPYYRNIFERVGLHPKDFKSEDVLQQLPMLDKDTLKNTETGEFLTEDRKFLLPIRTSGSTGQPLMILRSAQDHAEVSAVWMRINRLHGRRFFHRQVNIGSGRVVAAQGPIVRLQQLGLAPQTYQVSSFEPVERQITRLRQIKPHVISGYAVALEALAAAMIDAGVNDIRPAIVLSGGMELADQNRSLIERAFGRRINNIYAAVEVGPIAWECPAATGPLHLNDDVQITEFVDDEGRPVPEGEAGEVVVTQLNCTAQPLLRYRMGDIACVLPETCVCGRNLTRLRHVYGRSTHVIRSRDGQLLNSVVVSSILGPHPEVRRYQIRQVGRDSLMIVIVPSNKWTSTSGDAVISSFRDRLGDAFIYTLSICDDIPLTSQGKFQTIVPMSNNGPR
jgi:phenylacetate-CoA ligase